MKYRNAVKKFGSKVAVGSAALGTGVVAMAAPDATAISTEIGSISDIVDAAGGAMVTVFVGLMVFAVIIGMIARKGK